LSAKFDDVEKNVASSEWLCKQKGLKEERGKETENITNEGSNKNVGQIVVIDGLITALLPPPFRSWQG